jgi:hypothetical protein
MKALGDTSWTFRKRFSLLNLVAAGAFFVVSLNSASRIDAQTPILEFIQPTNGALFSTLDEIPIMLRAVASNDVFLTAEVLANGVKIADVSYCCAFCPCYRPRAGDETTLQIPAPWQNGSPPPNPWRGWTNVPARRYQLTARATGDNGTMLQAAPVTITVIDRTLWIFARSDGSATLTIPQGSMVPGRYDCEISEDFRSWTYLGPFQPGNVAAFFFDPPPTMPRDRRFYRSVYVPPH